MGLQEHDRSWHAHARSASSRRGVSLSSPNLDGSPEMPKQLLHMSELLVTKMLDMPISEMKKFLKETLLESTTSTNREEGEALLQSLEGLLENADGDIQIPNGDKSILETATVKGLQIVG